MHYAFVDTPQSAEFDPSALQLPDILTAPRGPEPSAVAPAAPIQRLQQQLQRETQRGASQVTQNVQQQLQMGHSEQRAEHLKKYLGAFQAHTAADKTPLLAALKGIASCYQGEQAPKDVATMSVVHPLLRCQAYKWDQLQAGNTPEPPAPEAGYLQKLRQLQGTLGPGERAALFRLVEAINHQLQQLSKAPVDSPPEAPTVTPLPTDFDPLQASRLQLQLRAKLQRTHSPTEKQQLQAELEQLQAQQQAFAYRRQLQALEKQLQDWKSDGERLPKMNAGHFESWRKLRISTLQSLARLFQGQTECEALIISAQRQLARLGMEDAKTWIDRERQLLQAPSVLQAWHQALGSLLDRALQATERLALQLQQSAWEQQLVRLENLQADWQRQTERLKQLEAAYVQADETSERQRLKQELLQHYAERMAQLVSVSSNQADSPTKV